jgi:hypothetical protein
MTAGRRNDTSVSRDWGTPEKYVRDVREVLGGEIDLDPCSNVFSIVRARVEYRLPETDGLKASWDFRRIYVNPPYGTDRVRGTRIKDWLKKCSDSHQAYGSEVLALVPVATNTSHWMHFVFDTAAGVAFLYDTRLRFLVDGRDEGKGAPMSCAMVYWGAHYDRFFRVFLRHGAVVDTRPLHRARGGQADGQLRTNFSARE